VDCSVAWGDFNNDGQLDLLIAGDTGSGLIARVYRNDHGAFTDIGAGLLGVASGSVAWVISIATVGLTSCWPAPPTVLQAAPFAKFIGTTTMALSPTSAPIYRGFFKGRLPGAIMTTMSSWMFC